MGPCRRFQHHPAAAHGVGVARASGRRHPRAAARHLQQLHIRLFCRAPLHQPRGGWGAAAGGCGVTPASSREDAVAGERAAVPHAAAAEACPRARGAASGAHPSPRRFRRHLPSHRRPGARPSHARMVRRSQARVLLVARRQACPSQRPFAVGASGALDRAGSWARARVPNLARAGAARGGDQAGGRSNARSRAVPTTPPHHLARRAVHGDQRSAPGEPAHRCRRRGRSGHCACAMGARPLQRDRARLHPHGRVTQAASTHPCEEA